MMMMQSAVQTQHAPAPPPPGVNHVDAKLDTSPSSPTASTAADSSTMDEKKEGPLADTAPYIPQHYQAQLQQQYQYFDASAYAATHHHHQHHLQQQQLQHPMMHPSMMSAATTSATTTGTGGAAGGGGVPPQQVYVNTAIQQQQSRGEGGGASSSLVTQFQSLAFNSGNPSDHQSSSSQQQQDNFDGSGQLPDGSGEEDLEEEGEEHTDEEEPVKLFVGQVPKTMNEEDIFPTFDSFGPLKDVTIIRDKHTQLHRGCAFVTYWSGADAEQAQGALHGHHTFPGARRPVQVKPAEPSTLPENKLFIGMLSRKAGEAEVQELFAPFGEIREVYMIRNADGSSKCAAFLRYMYQESAIQAIESLHNNLVMEGSARPLIVKFADNKHQRQQRHFRNVRRQEIMAVAMGPGAYHGYHEQPMAMAGPPGGPPQAYPPHMAGTHQQYGPPYPGAPGSGPPHSHPYAHGPLAHHTYHPHMYPSPHHAHHQYGAPPHAPYGPAVPYSRQDGSNLVTAVDVNNVATAVPKPPNPRPREGPAGANLFVYHLPHDLTDADLATAFNPFGNVISAKVYVDRYTGESKGFGFVSYDSVIAAESAIEQMNGFQIGNKRLKVQHKRVHGYNNGPPHMGGLHDPSGPIAGGAPPHVPHRGTSLGYEDEGLAQLSHPDVVPVNHSEVGGP